jgi:predicted fused transcriptional regulator/phosphomethylpyrimidine kinase
MHVALASRGEMMRAARVLGNIDAGAEDTPEAGFNESFALPAPLGCHVAEVLDLLGRLEGVALLPT